MSIYRPSQTNSERRPALRGAVVLDVSNGVERVRIWPRKRGAGETTKIAENQALFRNYSWAIKYLNPDMMAQIYDARKGMPLLPRDIAMMMLSGTLTYFITPSGKRIYSMAALLAVSQSLDTITQIPGMTLVRGPAQWQAVPYTPAGQPWWFAPPDPTGWIDLTPDSDHLQLTYDAYTGTYMDAGPIGGGQRIRMKVIPIPAPLQPWSLDVVIDPLIVADNYRWLGVGFRNSANGRFISVAYHNDIQMAVRWEQSLTVPGANLANYNYPVRSSCKFWRFISNGTTFQWQLSPDGVHYHPVYTAPLTNNIGAAPTQLGLLAGYAATTGRQSYGNCTRWVFSQ